MKYFSYLLLLQTVFWAGCEKSDGENGPAARAFPDPAFRQCVLEYFDFDGDGMVSDDEAAHATVIFCQEAGIVSLKGIERFPNLRVLHSGIIFPRWTCRPIARWRLSGVTTTRWSNSM